MAILQFTSISHATNQLRDRLYSCFPLKLMIRIYLRNALLPFSFRRYYLWNYKYTRNLNDECWFYWAL